MIHKVVNSLCIVKAYNYKTFVRYSALFINGLKATTNFVYLTPHIDFPERIKYKQDLQNELIRRKSYIDLNKLENLWGIYKELEIRKISLETKKEEIANEVSAYMIANSNQKETESLKVKLHLIKENIKKIKSPFLTAEEVAIVESLKLPNKLHPLTPDGNNNVTFANFAMPNNTKNHLDVGRNLNLLHFMKNENYYLKNDGAIFELGAKFYFSNILKKNNFIPFSNADFVKSIIIEGCGEVHTNADSSFILHHNEDTKVNVDSRLHLTGAGSIFSFFAYHAKNVIHGKALPIKYFTMGRQYKPSPDKDDCLFHVSQSSVIEIFTAVKTADELDSLLHQLIDITKDSYNQLGYHFRLSTLSAEKLHMWESLRIAVEMYSSSLKTYVEVGNISVSGDFISKRLQFTYTDNKESKFPYIISGTILNVPKFLACVLEQDRDFVLPELFKVENWNM